MVEKEVVCPRCGTRMTYRIEAELGNGNGRTVYYYYRCPRCGYRLQDLVVRVKRNNGSPMMVVITSYARYARRMPRQ